MAWRTSLVSVVPWGSSQNVTLDLHIDPAVDAVSPNHKKLLKLELGAGTSACGNVHKRRRLRPFTKHT
jgi:hypothetical protein